MSASQQVQRSELPPAQPAYILRGHKAQIHALHFLRRNSRLLSGDAEGIIILWDLAIKRPKGVWRGHNGGIIGFGVWNDDRIVSHGRDGKLNVWQLGTEDEHMLSKDLPIEESTKGNWKQPWILHSLPVHTLNFCAFAMCQVPNTKAILVATPAATEGVTIVHELPTEKPMHIVPPAQTQKTGMVMALRILFLNEALHVIVGYESGLTSVQKLKPNTENMWELVSFCTPHTQPILSLDFISDAGLYFTSGADAIVAMASLSPTKNNIPLRTNATKHSGQQGLTVRSDGRIFATAGWDGRMRVYSTKSLEELAILKWHKEGCYAVAFADMTADNEPQDLWLLAQHGTGKDDEKGWNIGDALRGKQVNTVRQQRESKTRDTRWLAAGSKDGKVSLWNVF